MSYSFTKTALEASHVVGNGPPIKLRGWDAVLDSTAPSARYFVLTIDAASLPANGSVTMLAGPVPVDHTQGADDYPFLDLEDVEVGEGAKNGVVVALSTTQWTLTIAGAYLSVTAARYSQ